MKTTSTHTANLLLLHLIVFIWGFTGILGKEITLDAFSLVWWRVLIAAASIAVYALVVRKSIAAPAKVIMRFAGVGLLTAAHWIFFFLSIKVSNVSVALAVLSTVSFFVAVVSPFIRKERFHLYEILLGAVVVFGLVLIFKFEYQYTWGIIFSLCAAMLAALFSSFNSTLVKTQGPTKIAFWEMLFGLLGLSLFLLFSGRFDAALFMVTSRDISMLLLLGIVCTGFAFIVGIEVMKVLSPFTCALTINLEPVYTIAFALLIYGESEWMSPQFYFGAIIILSTLFIDAWLKRKATGDLTAHQTK